MDKIRPLDLVFFQGQEIMSKSIMVVEYMVSKNRTPLYSHVGVVVDKSVLPIPEIGDGLYILESTLGVRYPKGGDVPIDVRGKGRFGVQIRVLEDVIVGYGGSVAIGPLTVSIDKDVAREKILDIWKKYKNGRYAGDILSLLSSAFSCLRPPAQVTRHIYSKAGKIIHIGEPDVPYVMCSQLVCLLYQKLGLVPKDIKPENVMPLDFLDIRGTFPTMIGDLIHFA